VVIRELLHFYDGAEVGLHQVLHYVDVVSCGAAEQVAQTNDVFVVEIFEQLYFTEGPTGRQYFEKTNRFVYYSRVTSAQTVDGQTVIFFSQQPFAHSAGERPT